MELAVGQFSSRGPVKIWQMIPVLKGIGYGNAVANGLVTTYYTVLIAISFFYFFSSFQTVLPWTVCDPQWKSFDMCYSSNNIRNNSLNQTIVELSHRSANTTFLVDDQLLNASTLLQSSSSLYFSEEVMKKAENMDDGLGLPEWRLALLLLLSWSIMCLIMIKGVASSGKAAYFTAIFPYCVLITLLIRGATLPGATDGMYYFIKPDWDKILDIRTWYEAVTQCFFSLGVGFGPIVMFSSFNQFRHNIYRDAMIVSLMDTFTSLLGGVTIFSILGNLAFETGKPVEDVVAGGPGLAFVSYPEAIAKFTIAPQLFSVLFFLMMITLGLGTSVSLSGGVITTIHDSIPKIPRWIITIVVCVLGYLIGLVYITPGGLFVLDVIDYFAAGFIFFALTIMGTVGICWIYGLNRLIKDIDFMLNVKLGAYWKLSWAYVIPISLITIFVYSVFNYKAEDIGSGPYPSSLISIGWSLAMFALFQIPLWACHVLCKQMGLTWNQTWRDWKRSLQPSDQWGPKNLNERANWNGFVDANVSKQSALWLPTFKSSKLWSRLWK